MAGGVRIVRRRAKVTADTERAWLTAYLPAEAVTPETALATLEELLAAAPVAELVQSAAS